MDNRHRRRIVSPQLRQAKRGRSAASPFGFPGRRRGLKRLREQRLNLAQRTLICGLVRNLEKIVDKDYAFR